MREPEASRATPIALTPSEPSAVSGNPHVGVSGTPQPQRPGLDLLGSSGHRSAPAVETGPAMVSAGQLAVPQQPLPLQTVPLSQVGVDVRVFWQQRSPKPPQERQKPSPVSLLHLSVVPLGQYPMFPSRVLLQHRSPRSPHGSHAPALHTFPAMQDGGDLSFSWQHGSPAPPHASQRPLPDALEQRRPLPVGQKRLFRVPLREDGQHRSPRSPHGLQMSSAQTFPRSQLGSSLGSRWQHGSPVPPQASQRPAPVALVQRRLRPSGQNWELRKSDEGQHGWPSCPHGPDCTNLTPVGCGARACNLDIVTQDSTTGAMALRPRDRSVASGHFATTVEVYQGTTAGLVSIREQPNGRPRCQMP